MFPGVLMLIGTLISLFVTLDFLRPVPCKDFPR